MDEFIQLSGAGKRKGPVMPRTIYKRLADGILQCIEESERDFVSLDELLDRATLLLGAESKTHLPGSLLLVKNDLKVKGIIRISFDAGRNQNIFFNRTMYYGV